MSFTVIDSEGREMQVRYPAVFLLLEEVTTVVDSIGNVLRSNGEVTEFGKDYLPVKRVHCFFPEEEDLIGD